MDRSEPQQCLCGLWTHPVGEQLGVNDLRPGLKQARPLRPFPHANLTSSSHTCVFVGRLPLGCLNLLVQAMV
jgi:hypothetical protein